MSLKYELPQLPYGLGDLEPVISKEIMDLHYNKHHKPTLITSIKLWNSILKLKKTKKQRK